MMMSFCLLDFFLNYIIILYMKEILKKGYKTEYLMTREFFHCFEIRNDKKINNKYVCMRDIHCRFCTAV